MSIFRKLFRNKEVNEIITDSEPQPESQQSPVLVYKAKMDVLSFSEKDRKKIAIKLDAEFRRNYGDLLNPDKKANIGLSKDGGVYLVYSLKPVHPDVFQNAGNALYAIWDPYTIE